MNAQYGQQNANCQLPFSTYSHMHDNPFLPNLAVTNLSKYWFIFCQMAQVGMTLCTYNNQAIANLHFLLKICFFSPVLAA